MALRDKLRRLEKTMRVQLGYFELQDGSRFYFDPEEKFRDTFKFFTDSMYADYKREARPEPPDLLKAVARAEDRGAALDLVVGGASHLPLDRDALVERGEFKPRSLIAGRTYEDLGVLEDLGE